MTAYIPRRHLRPSPSDGLGIERALQAVEIETLGDPAECKVVTPATASTGGSLRLAQLVRQVQGGTEGAPSRPLHQYRIGDELIAELQGLLLVRLKQRSLSFTGAESAAFVLFCAHHFTRTYTGGHWTWAIAKGTVDPENRLVPPVLYEIVDRGLRAWGRSVYWNGRHHECRRAPRSAEI